MLVANVNKLELAEVRAENDPTVGCRVGWPVYAATGAAACGVVCFEVSSWRSARRRSSYLRGISRTPPFSHIDKPSGRRYDPATIIVRDRPSKSAPVHREGGTRWWSQPLSSGLVWSSGFPP